MRSQFDQNREKSHLSESDMKSYLEGRMDASGMYNVECKLEEDRFQAAAMEGYENNPGTINDLGALRMAYYTKFAAAKPGIWQHFGVYLSAAAVVFVLITSVVLFYYFQPDAARISQNLDTKQENPAAIEEMKPLPAPIAEKGQKIAVPVSAEKKKMEAHAEEQNLQSPTEEVPQKSPELKAVPIVVEKENEDIAPALAGDALMNDDNPHANVGATSRNSLQFENNKDEPSGFAAEDKGLVYKNLNMQQTGKKTPSSVASQAVFNPPSADLGEIARNETKTTYLLDLKVIDYTEIYENQEEQNRRLHTTGVDAKYANKKEKMERAGSDEQVIDSVMYIDVLKESLASFKTGAYEKSLEDFSIILRKHPDELNAKFYGGLAYFEMGDYESALKNFDFVIEHPIPVFNPESEWYKAQSLVRLGNLKMAKDLLEKIIIEKGFYAEKARQLLDEIR